MLVENKKKFKEFKVVCYLWMHELYELFPELKYKDSIWNPLYMAIAPTQQEMDYNKRKRGEMEQEWQFIFQETARTGCYIQAQLSVGKEFILYPSSVSNLLGDKSLKYKHNRIIGVFDGQVYSDQLEDCINSTETVKDIACSLSDVLKCDTKLLFDGVEYNFTYEKN